MSDLNLKNAISLHKIVRPMVTVLCFILGLGMLTVVCLSIILFLSWNPHEPSDTQMLDFYDEHHAEFERLGQMLENENELSLVYANNMRCETVDRKPIFSGQNAKCDNYISLFKSLGIDWAYVNNRAPVYLSKYTWGLTGHGLKKGYLFATDISNLPGIIVDNTGTRGNKMPRYRKIDENWYIFFE